MLKSVEAKVKPDRDKLGLKKDASAKTYARLWWQFGRKGSELYSTISGMERVLVRARFSNANAFCFIDCYVVLAESVVIVATDETCLSIPLQSTFHEIWSGKYGSTFGRVLLYTPSDCSETFPWPHNMDSLDDIGSKYFVLRKSIMLSRKEGLSKNYNRFHKRDEDSIDIALLRTLHVEMDHAVAAAYGWTDLDLGHGFHETRQGIRYTVSEAARREILDRLLALNHERHEEEVKKGLHEKAKPKAKSAGKRPKKGVAGPLFGG
jgi:hypothetical protein